MNAPATGLRIAVADDVQERGQFFQELLPAMGHKVVGIVETGRQLIECCRQHRLDLVITDTKMPDMDFLLPHRPIGGFFIALINKISPLTVDK